MCLSADTNTHTHSPVPYDARKCYIINILRMHRTQTHMHTLIYDIMYYSNQ